MRTRVCKMHVCARICTYMHTCRTCEMARAAWRVRRAMGVAAKPCLGGEALACVRKAEWRRSRKARKSCRGPAAGATPCGDEVMR